MDSKVSSVFDSFHFFSCFNASIPLSHLISFMISIIISHNFPHDLHSSCPLFSLLTIYPSIYGLVFAMLEMVWFYLYFLLFHFKHLAISPFFVEGEWEHKKNIRVTVTLRNPFETTCFLWFNRDINPIFIGSFFRPYETINSSISQN